jgi:hypothetical protein
MILLRLLTNVCAWPLLPGKKRPESSNAKSGRKEREWRQATDRSSKLNRDNMRREGIFGERCREKKLT